MTQEPWRGIGITGESQFLKLLFEPHSNSLIAHFYRQVADGHGVKTLYSRSIADKLYRPLVSRSDLLTYEDVAASPVGPFVFVNVLKSRKEGNSYCGYDWFALQKIRMPDGDVVGQISDGQLPGTVNGYHAWPSALHGVGADGNTIYCTIGIPEANGSINMRYHVSKLHFDKGSFEVITELGYTFL